MVRAATLLALSQELVARAQPKSQPFLFLPVLAEEEVAVSGMHRDALLRSNPTVANFHYRVCGLPVHKKARLHPAWHTLRSTALGARRWMPSICSCSSAQ